MGTVVYKIPRVTDAQIDDAFHKLVQSFEPFQLTASVNEVDIGSFRFPDELNATYKLLLSHHSELICAFSLTVRGVVVKYQRGGRNGEPSLKSPVFDDLELSFSDLKQDRVAVAAKVIEVFRPVTLPVPVGPEALLEAQRALQQATFSRLELQLENVFRQTIDLRKEIDDQYRAKEQALQQAFDDRQAEAEAQLSRRVSELESERKALDDRRKQIDESDNTTARRKLRAGMLNDVAERVQNFGLSDASKRTRQPVAVGIVALCVFLLALLGLTIWELVDLRMISNRVLTASDIAAVAPMSVSEGFAFAANAAASSNSMRGTVPFTSEAILLWIRLALLSFGVTATILYYVRWQNQLASMYASTEQSLRQFHVDVNRANWVVETCLEWQKETHSEVPDALLDSLTRGLFSGKEPTQTVLHPADELASALLGSSSRLSLDVNGSRLDIDKPARIPRKVEVEPRG